jgi:cytochrome c-type biogenesis protein CcmE
LQDNLSYFYSPREALELRAANDSRVAPGHVFRLGGLVVKGSIARHAENNVPLISFEVTDLDQTMRVTYRGIPPDLFRDGQGVVAKGTLGADGNFTAQELLAKHDEKYMPPEVEKSLKKAHDDGRARMMRGAGE